MADPLALLAPGMRCLEVGPLHNPRIGKADHDVDYLDHAATNELHEKYQGHDLPTDIQQVDVVWSGDGPLREAPGVRAPYDFILASHVIEHVADVVGWLIELASVLREGGLISLVVPDKRFCFDVNRPTTELSDLVEAHLSRLSSPSYRHIVDFHTKIVAVDTITAWEQPGAYDGIVRPDVGDPDVFAWELCLRKRDAHEYVDVHCHTFTPDSFLDLADRLAKLDLFPFRVLRFHPTERASLEFNVVLERLPDAFTAEQRRHAARESVGTARVVPSESAGAACAPAAEVTPTGEVMLLSGLEVRLVHAKRRTMSRVRAMARLAGRVQRAD